MVRGISTGLSVRRMTRTNVVPEPRVKEHLGQLEALASKVGVVAVGELEGSSWSLADESARLKGELFSQERRSTEPQSSWTDRSSYRASYTAPVASLQFSTTLPSAHSRQLALVPASRSSRAVNRGATPDGTGVRSLMSWKGLPK